MCLAYGSECAIVQILQTYSINKRFIFASSAAAAAATQPAMNRTNCSGFKCNLKHLQNFCQYKLCQMVYACDAILGNDRNAPHTHLSSRHRRRRRCCKHPLTNSHIRIITLIVSTEHTKLSVSTEFCAPSGKKSTIYDRNLKRRIKMTHVGWPTQNEI